MLIVFLIMLRNATKIVCWDPLFVSFFFLQKSTFCFRCSLLRVLKFYRLKFWETKQNKLVFRDMSHTDIREDLDVNIYDMFKFQSMART